MPRRFAALLGLWLLCAGALAAVPERPRFRIVGAEQGLPSTEIRSLARDADGYLWIATADGLARYDGVGMRVWRYDPADPQGLPGNHIQELMVGADNRIWLAVEGGGISVLDAQRRGFRHYRKASHVRHLRRRVVRTACGWSHRGVSGLGRFALGHRARAGRGCRGDVVDRHRCRSCAPARRAHRTRAVAWRSRAVTGVCAGRARRWLVGGCRAWRVAPRWAWTMVAAGMVVDVPAPERDDRHRLRAW